MPQIRHIIYLQANKKLQKDLYTAPMGLYTISEVGELSHDPNNGNKSMFSEKELQVINQAFEILSSKAKTTAAIDSADLAVNVCKTKLAHLESEAFAALMLDSQHRLIEFVVLFNGTINAASVYPREVVKSALAYNAAAVIFSHNHPSGVAEPSQADISITHRLQSALELIDVRVLDHIVVSVEGHVSMAQRGLI